MMMLLLQCYLSGVDDVIDDYDVVVVGVILGVDDVDVVVGVILSDNVVVVIGVILGVIDFIVGFY